VRPRSEAAPTGLCQGRHDLGALASGEDPRTKRALLGGLAAARASWLRTSGHPMRTGSSRSPLRAPVRPCRNRGPSSHHQPPPDAPGLFPRSTRDACSIGVRKERHQRCAHGAAWAEVFGWREECLQCVEQVRCKSTQGRKQSRADHTGFPPHDVLGGMRSREKTEAPTGRSGLPDASTRGERQEGACRLSFAYGAGGRAVPVPSPVPGVFGVPPGVGPTGVVAGTVGLCT